MISANLVVFALNVLYILNIKFIFMKISCVKPYLLGNLYHVILSYRDARTHLKIGRKVWRIGRGEIERG